MQAGIIVRAFIASPTDVAQEREYACQAIAGWNAANSHDKWAIVEPVRAETHAFAETGGHPQDVINKQLLDRCDLLIGIFWSKLGTPTHKALSGTVQEINEFAQQPECRPVMLFFSTRAIPHLAASDFQRLLDFKKNMNGLYKEYDSPANFRQLVGDQLALVMSSVLKSRSAREEFDTISMGRQEQARQRPL